MKILKTLFLFLCLLALSCSTQPSEKPKGEINCDNYFKKWVAFRKKHNDCKKDSDCIVVGFKDDCECSRVIWGNSGDVINNYSMPEANKILFTWSSCDKSCGVDGTILINPACEDGICVAETRRCGGNTTP